MVSAFQNCKIVIERGCEFVQERTVSGFPAITDRNYSDGNPVSRTRQYWLS